MKRRISVVFTAAGMSERMGRRKQLMEDSEGVSLVERSLSAYCGAGFFEIVVVVGCSGGMVSERVRGRFGESVSIVFNPDFEKGMGTSVAAGVRSLSPLSEGCMIALADMPYMNPGVLSGIAERWSDRPDRIVAPSFGGRRGNPVLFPKEFYGELSVLSGDRGGSVVIASHMDRLELFEVGDDSVLRDIDTPEDWAAFRSGRHGTKGIC